MRSPTIRSAILILTGIIGASGVGLAAAASHGSDARLLGSASAMCLAHAPVLMGLYLLSERQRLATVAAGLLAAGTIVFSTDLLLRHFEATSLFPMAAPAGGMAMILGWLLVALCGVFAARAGNHRSP